MVNPYTKPETVICASCKRQKQEANFWFICWISAGRFQVAAWGRAALGESGRPICGLSCLTIELDKWATELRRTSG
jgi:hypothetical protein